MPSLFAVYVNVVLGALVVAIGGWLASNVLSMTQAALVFVAATAFLWWRAMSITMIWAWSTLFLGVECLAWPIATMLQIRSAGGDPSDEEMGAMLSAIVMGLFSAVFWMAFSYGLFKRAKITAEPTLPSSAPNRQ
jgi:hypothetical protein